MNDYWNLSDGQKRMVLEQAATKVGLPVESVEKDLWVTAVLECVFSLPYADKFVFKCPIKVLHGDESYYSMSKDHIVVPEKTQFKDGEAWVNTLTRYGLPDNATAEVNEVAAKMPEFQEKEQEEQSHGFRR